MTIADPIQRFAALPRRLFLDSSTLQTVLRYGELIWENVYPPSGDRAYAIPGFIDDLGALRGIFQVNERTGFDIVLSENTLREVEAKGEPRYTSWGLDVLDHWLIRVSEYRGRAFDGSGEGLADLLDEPRFGYLSAKDKLLLRDAVALECDAFLTMERKLARNPGHISVAVALQVLRPPEYWQLLRPCAAL